MGYDYSSSENRPPTRRYLIIFVLILLCVLLVFVMFGEQRSPRDKPSPQDWIDEDQILVYADRVVINVSDVKWARYSDTKSMDPTLDKGMNGIEILPDSPEEIKEGDIIAYYFRDDIIVHRVLRRGIDEEGIYYITKGDNLRDDDNVKVRFEDVRGVLIGVIY